MTSQELLERMRNGGYEITLKGEIIEVKQARWVDKELADLIRIHKPELIQLLKNEN
jgi:hypothetical protein